MLGFGGGFGFGGGGGFVIAPSGPAPGDPITIEQTATVRIAARVFLPIEITQSVTAVIAAEEDDAVYSPLDEAGAVLWFDLQDPTAFTLNGGSTGVTQVKNKVSNVQWLTPVNDTPYEATGLNGHPCLHPLVTGDRLQVATDTAVEAVFDAATTGQPFTMYIVFRPDAAAQTAIIFSAGNTGQSSAHTRTFGQQNTTGGKYQITQTTPAAGSLVGATIPSVAMTVLCFRSTGSTQSISINNGAADVSGTLNPAGIIIDQLGFFARVDLGPDSTCPGRFGEALIYNTAHDAAAQTRVYNYLAAKWAA